jgi:hypothetical protein
VQAYQTSQYVVSCGGIFLGKWRSSFTGSSDGKMNVQSACDLNTRYITVKDRNQGLVTLASYYQQCNAKQCISSRCLERSKGIY